MATHHDDGHGEQTGRAPLLEQRDTIGVWHPDVQQHQIVGSRGPRGAGLGGVLGEVDVVPLVVQDFLQQVSDAELIIYYQYVCHVSQS